MIIAILNYRVIEFNLLFELLRTICLQFVGLRVWVLSARISYPRSRENHLHDKIVVKENPSFRVMFLVGHPHFGDPSDL